jgi:hypothetical protein
MFGLQVEHEPHVVPSSNATCLICLKPQGFKRKETKLHFGMAYQPRFLILQGSCS